MWEEITCCLLILTHTCTHTNTGRQPCMYDCSSQLHLFVLPGLSCRPVHPLAFFPYQRTSQKEIVWFLFIYLLFFLLTFKSHLLLPRGGYGKFVVFFSSIIGKTSSALSMLSSFAHRGSYNPQFPLWIANVKWSVWACWKPPWDTAFQPSNSSFVMNVCFGRWDLPATCGREEWLRNDTSWYCSFD